MSAVAQLPRPARPVPAARRGPLGVLAQVASYFSSTWALAAAGVVILVVSLVLMAHSAPGQGPAPGPFATPQRPVRPGPARPGPAPRPLNDHAPARAGLAHRRGDDAGTSHPEEAMMRQSLSAPDPSRTPCTAATQTAGPLVTIGLR